jgi:hypothetical protein
VFCSQSWPSLAGCLCFLSQTSALAQVPCHRLGSTRDESKILLLYKVFVWLDSYFFNCQQLFNMDSFCITLECSTYAVVFPE